MPELKVKGRNVKGVHIGYVLGLWNVTRNLSLSHFLPLTRLKAETMNFSDLRAILQYVPQFRGRTFVVALDGAVIDSPDFSNILLDLAVLRSLNIRVVLVHGAAAQIDALAAKRGILPSNADGTGITDESTLEVAIDAISRLSNRIMQNLTTVKVRAATANAIHAHPAGVIGGVDAGFSGTINRVDSTTLETFLDQDILPVVPPLGFDADGQTLRVNSDVVAREVAAALGAAKILFIGSFGEGYTTADLETRQWSTDRCQRFLDTDSDTAPPSFVSKIRQAVRATKDGVPRVHLIEDDREDALLAELFSNEGVGLMVYGDDYHRIRQATHADVDEIYSLVHRAVEDEQLIERSREEIQEQVEDFTLLEIDQNIVGCVAVHHYPESSSAELACLFVKRGHTGQGYGNILMAAAKERAERIGVPTLFALSTQAAGYLERGGFQRSEELDTLPAGRLEKWQSNGRK
ncbi:MAG: amino-acid N-acetyltransferase, partial [Verrucomicrobiota bacterium]